MGRPDGKSHLEDLDVNGRIILKWIFKKLDGCHDWIALFEDRESWWAVVNSVMHLREGNFLSS